MSTFVDEIKPTAQKEYRYDPRSETKESLYQPDQAGLMFLGVWAAEP